MELNGQCAVVTGGASGIGSAVALTLASAGASVLVTDIDEPAARRVAERCDGRASWCRTDVRRSEDTRAAIEACLARFGGCSILVHAAAPLVRSGSALDAPTAVWQEVVDVVLTGGYFVARDFARGVQAAGRGGAIVNLISTVVNSPRVGSAAYCAAKSGLVGLSRVLAMELAPLGIRVNAVGPGLTRTPRVEANNPESYNRAFLKQVPLARMGEPQDVADLVRFLVSPAAAYITGQVIYVDGGYSAGKLSVTA